jgi:hypothetical protein
MHMAKIANAIGIYCPFDLSQDKIELKTQDHKC